MSVGFNTAAMGNALGDFYLRRLRGDDATAYKEVRLRALRDHPEAFVSSWEEEQDQTEAWFAERLENGHVIAGVSAAGDIVGTIGIRRSQGLRTRHIGSLWGMYVSPAARGTGLARQLLEAGVAEFGPSIRSVRLCVEANNAPAIRLYESVGFKRWAVEAEAAKVGDTFHDDILMRLDVCSSDNRL